MADLQTRPIVPDEMRKFILAFRRMLGFAQPLSDEEVEREKTNLDLSRSLATFDGDEVVGTAHSHLFDISVPGGADVKAAGVTAVATQTTHRRQGVVTGLMRRQLVEARDRGEAMAVLVASEGGIYRRFGYGVASKYHSIEIDPFDTRGFITPPGVGRVERRDIGPDHEIVRSVTERMRQVRPGWIKRPEHFWNRWCATRSRTTTS